MTAVRFVRKLEGDSFTVCVELHKKEILEARIVRAEAESSLKNPGADVVALRVVCALMKNLTEEEDEGGCGLNGEGEGVVGEEHNAEKVDKLAYGDVVVERLGEKQGEVDKSEQRVSRRERMYARGDVLEALSDCVVVLRRLPVLLAQYKVQYGGPSSSHDSDRCVSLILMDKNLIMSFIFYFMLFVIYVQQTVQRNPLLNTLHIFTQLQITSQHLTERDEQHLMIPFSSSHPSPFIFIFFFLTLSETL
jgi:hypothetical protein